jgi:SAM-dependent methyltransferase
MIARNALTRLLLQRATQPPPCPADELLYDVDVALLAPWLRPRWSPLAMDADAEAFLTRSAERSWSVLRELAHGFVAAIASPFLSRTSINGLLARGGMHVLSTGHARLLLAPHAAPVEQPPLASLLDVGAGDGGVTAQLAPLFRRVVATEISPIMQWRLRQRGFVVPEGISIGPDNAELAGEQFDVVALLNILDRCATPVTLLRQTRARLKPDVGRALIALVLPVSQYVEVSTHTDHRAIEPLSRVKGRTWEEQASSFAEHYLLPAGLDVVSLSRVPYLCEGDLRREYYYLDDAIFVVRASPLAATDTLGAETTVITVPPQP